MKHVYFISGLGADERVFSFLRLDNILEHHLKWEKPNDRDSLREYAKKLALKIPNERPILIGVSFGGVVAIEIAKLIDVEKVILISSVKTQQGIPSYLRIAGALRIHKLIPKYFFRSANPLLFWFFGVHTENGKRLMRKIMNDSDLQFMAWAIDRILHWKNKILPDNMVSIHGTQDRVLPFTTADHKIGGGGHLMIVSHADEISKVLKKILQ